jgi:hypothetical protein
MTTRSEIGESIRNAVPDPLKPVLGTSRDPSSTKQGHQCCGGVCDVRRAVIVVNLINATLITIAMISISFTKYMYNENYHGYYGINGIERTLSVLRIMTSVVGILGALYYKIYLVGFAGTMYAVDSILALLGFNLFPHLIISLLFAYPHYFLMKEMNNGIMTEENYHNEEHSCCCIRCVD